MDSIYTFVAEIPLVAKQRHRFRIKGNVASGDGLTAVAYTPKETKLFEQDLRLRFTRWMRNFGFKIAPKVPMEVWFEFHFAKNSYKGKEEKPYHTKKPDFDNLAKSTSDALNKLLYHDDSYITDAHIKKRYNVLCKDKIVIRFKYLGDKNAK